MVKVGGGSGISSSFATLFLLLFYFIIKILYKEMLSTGFRKLQVVKCLHCSIKGYICVVK